MAEYPTPVKKLNGYKIYKCIVTIPHYIKFKVMDFYE